MGSSPGSFYCVSLDEAAACEFVSEHAIFVEQGSGTWQWPDSCIMKVACMENLGLGERAPTQLIPGVPSFFAYH